MFKYSFYFFIIILLSQCGFSKQEEEILNQFLSDSDTKKGSSQEYKSEEGNVSLSSTHLKRNLFSNGQFIEKIEASEFFICEKKEYFIENSDYCFLFKDFYFINQRENEDHFYLISEKAYSDNNLTHFLFYNMRIILANNPYVILMQEATLNRTANELKSSTEDNTNKLEGLEDKSKVEGKNMKINYDKQEITLEDSKIMMKDIEGL